MKNFDLSIVVPIYNEASFLPKLLDNLYQIKVSNKFMKTEIIMINDGSTDNSSEICSKFALKYPDLTFIDSKVNQGKGSAVQQGIAVASGNYILIQDSDLEYNPKDIPAMYNVILRNNPMTAVYGSRVLGARKYGSKFLALIGYPKNQSLLSYLFNRLLTIIFYLRFHKWISDLLTGYKLYPRELFHNWQPRTMGFETDHEITIRLIQMGFTIKELPISFNPRTRKQGKKIGIKDAFIASRILLFASKRA